MGFLCRTGQLSFSSFHQNGHGAPLNIMNATEPKLLWEVMLELRGETTYEYAHLQPGISKNEDIQALQAFNAVKMLACAAMP